MDAFIHQLLAGLATGGIYATVALALVMIYQATHHINFAQGEMAMFSTFIAWALLQAGLPYWWAFLATVALSFVLGAAVEFAIIRPMHKAADLAQVVVFIGLLIVFHSLAGWIFGYTIKEFPSPFPADAWYGSALMSAHEVGTIFVALAIVALLFAFFRLTPLGLAMRAAAQNPAPGGHLRGAHADAGLGPGRRHRRGGRDDGGARGLPRSAHDERRAAVCLCGRAAGRHRQPRGRRAGRLHRGRA